MGVNELLDIKGIHSFLSGTAWNLSHIRYKCHSRAKGSIWYAMGFAEVGDWYSSSCLSDHFTLRFGLGPCRWCELFDLGDQLHGAMEPSQYRLRLPNSHRLP